MYWWWNWRWHKWWLHELYAPVSNNAVEDFSSKPSEADFDVVIDKPLKQEVSLKFKTKNCPVNEVEQTMTYSDEQEIQSITTESINNTDNNSVQQKNEVWRKGTTLILRRSTIFGLRGKKISRNRKIKAKYRPGVKIKDMYHYAILLLEKKSENIILHLGTNDASYKSSANILKCLIELKDFIQDKMLSCKKVVISSPTLRTNKESAVKFIIT